MEADHWYNKSINTGTEAYNYGMQLLDSIFHDMYLNLSISPIFPAQYAQSRRIACDAWNQIKDTEYTMNALSWGWWIDRIYSPKSRPMQVVCIFYATGYQYNRNFLFASFVKYAGRNFPH